MKTYCDRKTLLSLFLVFALLFSFSYTVSADTGFRYQHDPCDNASAMQDIVRDEHAVYGFRPSETGSLKMYADLDWSDPEIVAAGRSDRIAYHESISSMYAMLQEMQSDGRSTEEIARALSTRRNEIRLESYADDPEGLAALKERNLEQYGHEEGPLPDELYVKYGSWEKVIEKSFSTNMGMDACLGLYDDYYFLYVALGKASADVTFRIPQTLTCGFLRSCTFTPDIDTNAADHLIRYESADPRIAQIDENGTVTGRRFGTTTVYCILTDASGTEHVSDPCTIRVRSNLVLWLLMIVTYLQTLF